MVNYGIVYGLSAYGLADRLQIPQEEAQEFIDALPRALPEGASSSSTRRSSAPRDGGLRDHAVRAHPARPGAALAPVPDAQPGRAAGGEHGHPGHRRRHHQGRDGALPRRAARRRPRRRGSCSRSTTSCCSRARRPRSSAASEIVRARDGRARSRSTRRSRSTSASGENWLDGEVVDARLVAVAGDGRRGRLDRAAGADQRHARQVRSATFRRPRSRSSSGSIAAARRSRCSSAAASASSARRATLPWYYLTGGVLGAVYVTTVLVTVRTSAPAA